MSSCKMRLQMLIGSDGLMKRWIMSVDATTVFFDKMHVMHFTLFVPPLLENVF
jgi:hypothetical protein